MYPQHAIEKRASVPRLRDLSSWVGIVVSTVGFTFPVVINSFLTGREWQAVQQWARTTAPFMGARKIHVHGVENLQTPGVLVMPNHQSHLDPLVLLGLSPVQVYFLAKASLFRIPFFGQALRASGQIAIERKDRTRAFASIDRAGEEIRGGKSVIIFPEGTRACREEMGPFKSGGFVLAHRGKLPIVPVGIVGTREIWPPGSGRFEPGDIAVAIGAPIDAGAYADKEGLMAAVRERIDELRVEARAILRGGSPPTV